jgi:hypothetical protein
MGKESPRVLLASLGVETPIVSVTSEAGAEEQKTAREAKLKGGMPKERLFKVSNLKVNRAGFVRPDGRQFFVYCYQKSNKTWFPGDPPSEPKSITFSGNENKESLTIKQVSQLVGGVGFNPVMAILVGTESSSGKRLDSEMIKSLHRIWVRGSNADSVDKAYGYAGFCMGLLATSLENETNSYITKASLAVKDLDHDIHVVLSCISPSNDDDATIVPLLAVTSNGIKASFQPAINSLIEKNVDNIRGICEPQCFRNAKGHEGYVVIHFSN